MRSAHKYTFVICLLLASVIASDYHDLVCSGFVEFPSDTTKGEEAIDFSRIEVHLVNQDNHVVEKTVCSENGFYLLPIYDRKKYYLTVVSKDNYQFSPDKMLLDLEEKSSDEAKSILEAVHSFKFVGFSIKERVTSDGAQKDAGPSGIALEIFDNLKKVKIGQTTTREAGEFVFENLMAGEYEIKPKSVDTPDYIFKKAAGDSMVCEVSWKKSYKCRGDLVIAGYRVTGRFQNENQPLENLYVFLYPAQEGSAGVLPSCSQSPVEDHPLKGKQEYFCYSVSDADGAYSIRNVPHGSYLLYIKSFEAEKKIEIEPPFVKVNVNHEVLNVENSFQVNTFSIQGKVSDLNGNGIANVKIMLDGEEKSISDKNGNYAFEKVKTGTYTLEGHHEHLFFEPIHDLKLSVNLKRVPNLMLSFLHICGKVFLNFDNVINEESQVIRDSKVTIYLEGFSEKRMVIPDNDGNYCFEVKPGKYTVYPSIVSKEKGKEIALSPTSYEKTIGNEPILDLNFYRPKVSVSGAAIFLPSSTPDQIKKTTFTISSTSKKFQQTVNADSNGGFTFMNVLSGNYEISIGNTDFCWDIQKIPIEITNNNNITSLKFEQTGFAMKYQTKHNMNAKFIYPDGSSRDLTLDSYENLKCLSQAGEYRIVPDECYSFKEEAFRFSTSENSVVQLNPDKFLISGQLVFDSSKFIKNDPEIAQALAQSIIENNYLNVESYSRENLLETQKIQLALSENKNSVFKFSYKYYAASHTRNKISAAAATPKNYSALVMSQPQYVSLIDNLLFYPNKYTISLERECIRDEYNFEIKSGVIILGSIVPELSEVNITVLNERNEYVDSFFTGNSTFKLGPYEDSVKYKVEASKQGYKFEQKVVSEKDNVLALEMQAQRLSTLKITINDASGQPIPNVLIFISSISKTNMIRLNNYTNEEGVFLNPNFIKGEYLIKAVLKEYVFEPMQKTIKISDGANEDISIVGKKIAFSIYGRVRNLNNQGIENITVDAFLEKDKKVSSTAIESATCDKNGNFRIRGLNPNTVYQIKIKPNPAFDFYRPDDIRIEMKNHDISDIDFILFEKRGSYGITGAIEYDEKFDKTELEEFMNFEVEIFSSKNLEEPIPKKKLFFNNKFFEFEDLERGEYLVKLSFRKNRAAQVQEIVKMYNLNDLKEGEYELFKSMVISKTGTEGKKYLQGFSLAAPLLIVLILFSFLNLEKTSNFINSITTYLISRGNGKPETKKNKEKKK